MRATVLRRDDQVHSHVLVIVIHHIAADGFSTVPLARDLMSAYSSRVNGEAPQWAQLGIQYADYALWQRGWLGSESDSRSLISKQLGYWAENLAGAPEVLDIPTDRPRVDVRSLRRGRIRFVFGPKVHAGVVALSRKRNATVFMVVHAALAVLLARLSDEDDVAVGTPSPGVGGARTRRPGGHVRQHVGVAHCSGPRRNFRRLPRPGPKRRSERLHSRGRAVRKSRRDRESFTFDGVLAPVSSHVGVPRHRTACTRTPDLQVTTWASRSTPSTSIFS